MILMILILVAGMARQLCILVHFYFCFYFHFEFYFFSDASQWTELQISLNPSAS